MGEQSDQKRPGFDYWITHKGQGKYFDNTFNINGRRQMLKGYYTHRVTELAADWLKQPRQQPFLMIMGHKAPHCPFEPEPKYAHIYDNLKIEKPPTANDFGPDKPSWYKDRVPTWHGIDGHLFGLKDYDKFIRHYHASILSVDDSVGEIYQTLKQTGQLDNTLLIFTSDNGFLLGEHGATDKRTMHEESIRVPMLVRYPQLIQQPRVIDQMMLNTDLSPSIIDICGARPIENIHGRSWKKLVKGQPTPWRKSWHYAYNYEKEFPYTPNVRGIRTDNWKYVHYPNGPNQPDTYQAELYNLKKDLQETKNLINDPDCAPKVKQLKTELNRLLAATGALPDKMPLNPQIKSVLPEKSIR
jgi:N-acetylglucosamine-6-sulfatase